MKIKRQVGIILPAVTLIGFILGSVAIYIHISQPTLLQERRPDSGFDVQLPDRNPGPLQVRNHRPTPTPTTPPQPTTAAVAGGNGGGSGNGSIPGQWQTIQPSPPGNPTLQRLEQVTTQAFGDDGVYVPNSWGAHKNRIVRTSTGDLFTVFISAGNGLFERVWHLMHRAPNGGGWQEINSGNAGAEPINILVGPHDDIHLFAWPHTMPPAEHIYSTDLGQTFHTEMIAGQWNGSADNQEQGYSGAGMNAQGDMVFFQTGEDQPGRFNWAYYSHSTQQWQFHSNQIDYRYTYAYFFPGYHNDLTMVAVRDAKRDELGYPVNSGFPYVFNSIRYYRVGDVNNPDATFSQLEVVAPIAPRNLDDYDVTYLEDSYIDTQGRMHILYNNLYDGNTTLHHVLIDNNQVVKDVPLSITYAPKSRIIQDTRGHFYIVAMDRSGQSINVYPGSASDTDGTQLNAPVQLNIGQYPGCTDDDFCHPPTFTVPRNGHALQDYIDGTYGNHGQEIYFRIQLR